MKIFTKEFIQNASIINKMYNGDNPLASQLLLNFEDGNAYLRNVDGILFRFSIQVESPEKLPNLLVDSKKFLTICSYYQQEDACIYLKKEGKGYVFYCNKDEYKITCIVENGDYDTTVFYEEIEGENFIVDEELFKIMKTCSTYLVSSGSDQSGICLKDHDIFVVHNIGRQNAFFTKLSLSYPESVFNFYMIQSIFQSSVGSTITFNPSYIKIENGKIVFIIPMLKDLEFNKTLISSDDFKQAYNHESHIILERKPFLDMLDSLTLFTSEVLDDIFRFYVNDDKNLLTIEVFKEDNIIKRTLPIVQCEGKFDFPMVMSNDDLKKNIKSLSVGDTVTIQIGNKKIGDKESTLVNLYTTNPNEHAVMKRFHI